MTQPKAKTCNLSTSSYRGLRFHSTPTRLRSFPPSYPTLRCQKALGVPSGFKGCINDAADRCRDERHSTCHRAIASQCNWNTLFEGHLTEGGENTFTFSRPLCFPGRSLPVKCVLLSLDSILGNIFWQSDSLSDFCNPRPCLHLPQPLSSYLPKKARLFGASEPEAFFSTEWGGKFAYFSRTIWARFIMDV